MLTIDDAERIRKSLNLTLYDFSTRLGYSRTTYYYAVQAKSLSRGLAHRIATVFGRRLHAMRKNGE